MGKLIPAFGLAAASSGEHTYFLSFLLGIASEDLGNLNHLLTNQGVALISREKLDELLELPQHLFDIEGAQERHATLLGLLVLAGGLV